MFKKMSIKQKIQGMIVILVVVISCVGIYIDSAIKPIAGQWASYQTQVTSRQQLLQMIKSDFGYGGLIHNFKNYVLRGQPKYLGRISKNHEGLVTAIEKYQVLEGVTSEEQKALTAILKVAGEYHLHAAKINQLASQKRSPSDIDGVVKINDKPALQAFEVLNQHYQQLTDEYTSSIDSVTAEAGVVLLVGLTVLIFLSVMVVGYLYVVVVTPLNRLNRTLGEIASGEGDLSVRLDDTREDELGQLAHGFNLFVAKLQSMIRQQQSIIDEIAKQASSLQQIAASTNQAMGSQQQDTQQLESKLSEFKNMLESVVENTGNASIASNNVGTRSTEGQQIVNRSREDIQQLENRIQRVSAVLGELNSVSNEIAQVVTVIGGIAAQTNLLALNAAIEAARAGESGRGFAVVADEVRGLAQHTAESLEDIRHKTEQLQSGTQNAVMEMDHGQQEVKASVSLSQSISDDIRLMGEEVSAICDVNAQIASATKQQHVVTEEMNSRVHGITQMSDSIFKDSRQVTEHSDSLARLSNNLKKLAGEFKV